MITGKIATAGGKYSVELSNGESFNIAEEDLSGSLRVPGAEVSISLASVGGSVDQSQARELLNYLLQIK
jgi:hypothetical protein